MQLPLVNVCESTLYFSHSEHINLFEQTHNASLKQVAAIRGPHPLLNICYLSLSADFERIKLQPIFFPPLFCVILMVTTKIGAVALTQAKLHNLPTKTNKTKPPKQYHLSIKKATTNTTAHPSLALANDTRLFFFKYHLLVFGFL